MTLSEKEREQLKREIDNYEYILNLVEMNHYERGFFSLKAEIRLSAFHFEHFTTHFS